MSGHIAQQGQFSGGGRHIYGRDVEAVAFDDPQRRIGRPAARQAFSMTTGTTPAPLVAVVAEPEVVPSGSVRRWCRSRKAVRVGNRSTRRSSAPMSAAPAQFAGLARHRQRGACRSACSRAESTITSARLLSPGSHRRWGRRRPAAVWRRSAPCGKPTQQLQRVASAIGSASCPASNSAGTGRQGVDVVGDPSRAARRTSASPAGRRSGPAGAPSPESLFAGYAQPGATTSNAAPSASCSVTDVGQPASRRPTARPGASLEWWSEDRHRMSWTRCGR